MLPRPTEEQEEAIRRLATAAAAPPPPARPVVGECCERGCEPCVFDYWTRGLERWAERHGLTAELTRIVAGPVRR